MARRPFSHLAVGMSLAPMSVVLLAAALVACKVPANRNQTLGKVFNDKPYVTNEFLRKGQKVLVEIPKKQVAIDGRPNFYDIRFCLQVIDPAAGPKGQCIYFEYPQGERVEYQKVYVSDGTQNGKLVFSVGLYRYFSQAAPDGVVVGEHHLAELDPQGRRTNPDTFCDGKFENVCDVVFDTRKRPFTVRVVLKGGTGAPPPPVGTPSVFAPQPGTRLAPPGSARAPSVSPLDAGEPGQLPGGTTIEAIEATDPRAPLRALPPGAAGGPALNAPTLNAPAADGPGVGAEVLPDPIPAPSGPTTSTGGGLGGFPIAPTTAVKPRLPAAAQSTTTTNIQSSGALIVITQGAAQFSKVLVGQRPTVLIAHFGPSTTPAVYRNKLEAFAQTLGKGAQVVDIDLSLPANDPMNAANSKAYGTFLTDAGKSLAASIDALKKASPAAKILALPPDSLQQGRELDAFNKSVTDGAGDVMDSFVKGQLNP